MTVEGSAKFLYYGIAQYEIEVIYSALRAVFGHVDEQQLPIEDAQYVSMIKIEFPIPFGESFFQKFSMERWYKIKGLIKEMKRRRGGRRGVKVFISFCGIAQVIIPRLIFSLLNKNNRIFEMAIEKIEYLVDIVPIQMQTFTATNNSTMEEIVYYYDEVSFKWSPYSTKYADGSEYCYLSKTKEWKKK